MKNTAISVGVIVLSLAGAACNQAGDVATVDEADDATMTTGTGGAETAAPAAQPPVEAQLPPTASPLALIAGLGVLAVAGAAGLRMLR